MIVACPQCSARYRIDDRKVAGKRLRTTCRKCGHIFVVSEASALTAVHARHDGEGEQVESLVPTPASSTQGALGNRTAHQAPPKRPQATSPKAPPPPSKAHRPAPARPAAFEPLAAAPTVVTPERDNGGAALHMGRPDAAMRGARGRAASAHQGSERTAAPAQQRVRDTSPSPLPVVPMRAGTERSPFNPPVPPRSSATAGIAVRNSSRQRPAMRQDSSANAHPQPSKRAASGALGTRPFSARPHAMAGRGRPPESSTRLPSNAPPVEDGWFAGIDGQATGPLPASDMRQRIRTGEMNPETLVWREGMAGWQPIARVPSLAPMAAAAQGARGHGALDDAFEGALGDDLDENLDDALDDALDESATAIWSQDDVSGASMPEPSDPEPSREPTRAVSPGRKRSGRKRTGGNVEGRASRRAERARSIAPAAEPEAWQHSSADNEIPHSGSKPRRLPSTHPLVQAEQSNANIKGIRESSRAARLSSQPPAAASRRRRLPIWAFAVIAAAIALGVSLGVLLGLRWVFPQTMSATPPVKPQPVPERRVLDEPSDLYIPPEEETEIATETPTEETQREDSSLGARSEPRRPKDRPDETPADNLSDADKARLARMAGGGVKGASSGAFAGGGSNKNSGSQGLTSAQLTKVVNENRPALQRCHEKAMRGRPSTPRMRVEFFVNVGSSGVVTKVEISGSTIPEMTMCMTQTIKRWRFPAATSDSSVKFPVIFDAGA